jgi:exodeoxyribonuclease VII small subunit
MGGDSEASPQAADPADAVSFEVALERLEAIVDRLEQGGLDLEGALAAFEEGVKLSRHCSSQLDAAERRIEVLVEQGGLATRPFGESEDTG